MRATASDAESFHRSEKYGGVVINFYTIRGRSYGLSGVDSGQNLIDVRRGFYGRHGRVATKPL